MLLLTTLPAIASADTLQVGPTRTYSVPSEAAAIAADGDIIEIDAGTYTGDVARWFANDLVIRGVGGMAHLEAGGNNAEGKAIWVIKGNNTTVEYIEFSGCTVPDQNGAGIRQEGNGLTVRHCYFHDNENGILGGGGNILIEFSEFANNGYGDGYSHNMYISNTASFTLQYSYSHHARIGHNVKSRAEVNYILYNRIMDEADGTSSYALDLPNGGTSYVIGNLFQQGPDTDNSTIFAYAAEGASNASSDLYVVNNTFVNDRASGTFISNNTSTQAVVYNNIFAGGGTPLNGPGDMQANLESDTPGLVNMSAYDYRLLEGSPAIDQGIDPGTGGGYALLPEFHYIHPASSEARVTVNGAVDIGAYEYGAAPPQDAGVQADAATPGADATYPSGDCCIPGADASDGGNGGSSGCNCNVTSRPNAATLLWILLALVFLLSRLERRKGSI